MDQAVEKKLGIRLKIWLEIDDRPVIGEGRLRILKAIDETGSLLGASKKTGVAYRKLRGAVHDMESLIGRPIINTHRGGEDGGGASLTPLAHDLIKRYETDLALFQKSLSEQSNKQNK